MKILGLCSRAAGAGALAQATPHASVPGRRVAGSDNLTLHPRVRRRYEEMRSSTPIASFSCSYDTNAMAIEGTTLT